MIRMTPFELSLGHDLDIECQRFNNEWLFKWYNTNIEGRIVDVPSFDGGRITRNGVFQGLLLRLLHASAPCGTSSTSSCPASIKRWSQDWRQYGTQSRGQRNQQ